MGDLAKITIYELDELYKRFKIKEYNCKTEDDLDKTIIDRCIALFERDYVCEIFENKIATGRDKDYTCTSYPSRMPIPTYERVGDNNQETIEEESKLFQYIINAASRDQLEHLAQSAKYASSTSVQKCLEIKKQAEGHAEGQSSSDKSSSDEEINMGQNLFDIPFLHTYSSHTSEMTHENCDLEDCVPTKYPFRKYLNFSNAARCWYRFPVPTIFCKGKYICRSASISVDNDVWAKGFLFNLAIPEDTDKKTIHILNSHVRNPADRFSQIRFYDIHLLESLGVSAIVDLMIEYNKSKLLGLVYTASSEKEVRLKNNDYLHYSTFQVDSTPYPGCEYFSEYTSNKFNSAGMKGYDWNNKANTAELSLHETELSSTVCTDWNDYKKWDLRTLTANYLRLMQKYILDPKSKETGLLVHCISGWDRTPLFISLLRMSLWADGHIHPSLDPQQILYLTLAYDWYLFGHKLPERLKSKENILHFCFDFLEEIGNEKFVEQGLRERHPSTGSSASEAYDSATDASETAASSFGSVASFASSSNAPLQSLSTIPLVKLSPIKPHSGTASNWPFDKENGFSFDGISENEPTDLVAGGGDSNLGLGTVSYAKRSPVRSPLRERNKKSPKSKSPHAGGRGRSTINGVVRDLMSKRTRKISVTEPPNMNESVGEQESFEVLDQENLDYTGCESRSNVPPMVASNPVPVPGVRSRNSSSSESISSSWNVISKSTESVLNDSFNFNCFVGSQKTSGYKFVPVSALTDSCNTVKEGQEGPFSSSPTSSQESIRVIDRRVSFILIKRAFSKMYEGTSFLKEPQPQP